MMKFGIVYKWEEKSTGKCYIGATIRPTKRFNDHIKAESKGSYFHIRIRELGIQGNYEEIMKYFDFSILEKYEIKDNKVEIREILDEKEQYYINEYNSVYPNGFNKQSKVKHTTVKKLTDEQREKAAKNREKALKNRGTNMSKCLKKVNFVYDFLEDDIVRKDRIERNKESLNRYKESEKYKKYLEEVHKRKLEREEREKQAKIDYWNSEEGKERIKRNKEKCAKNITKYNKSEAHRKLVIETNKNKRIKVAEYSKEGELIRIYDSITEAAEYKNLVLGAITACLKGRTKTSGGSIWKYID